MSTSPELDIRKKIQDFAVRYYEALGDDDYDLAEKLTVEHLQFLDGHIAQAVQQALENVRIQLRGEDPDQYRPNDMVSMSYVEEVIDARLATLSTQPQEEEVK